MEKSIKKKDKRFGCKESNSTSMSQRPALPTTRMLTFDREPVVVTIA